MLKLLKRIISKLLSEYLNRNIEFQESILMLQAKEILSLNNLKDSITNLSEVEFKVYSQWGEDGIIQYLINKVEIANKVFVEFGVEDYTESNTRFLLKNNNWSGLVIDGNKENIEYIKKDNLYWKYDLTAVHSFITKKNINQIFIDQGVLDEVGLLSIDIDGSDYWIWKNIEVINPVIVICEYNSIFGKDLAVTVPYKDDFERTKEHYSNLYFGASLKALCILAEEKGYKFVGTTSAGNDAFFIRNDAASIFQ